jgi:hypothetical protein
MKFEVTKTYKTDFFFKLCRNNYDKLAFRNKIKNDVLNKVKKKQSKSLAQVTHTCNPSFSGGRDEDCSLKPDWANSS